MIPIETTTIRCKILLCSVQNELKKTQIQTRIAARTTAYKISKRQYLGSILSFFTQWSPLKLLLFDAEFYSAPYKTNKKVSTDSGENINKDYWLEVVKKIVFRPNPSLFSNDLG
jgi:hypothetical protein